MSSPSRGTALLCGALLLLLAGALFREAVFGGEVLSQADFLLRLPPWSAEAPRDFVPGNPELSDQATQFQPWALLAQRQLDAGVPSLWNRTAALGQPLLANFQSALLSPFAIWLHLLPFGAALLAIAVSKLLLAGVGTALLARRLGCSPVAATLAGLGYALGGYELLWLGHPHSSAGALLPVLLLLVERWLDEDGRGWLPALWALAVAALVLCGHVETALHVALVVGLWAWLRGGRRPLRARLRTMAALLFWALAGALVAGVQWAPFAEYLFQSTAYAQRSGLQDEWRVVPWRVLPWVLAAGALIVLAFVAARRAAVAQQRGRWDRAALAAVALLAAGAAALSLLEVCGLSPLHRLLWWPDAWGNPVPARELPWAGPRAYVNVNGGYAGVLVLPLALVGLLCSRRRDAVRTAAWIWLLGFTLGFELPIVSDLIDRLPLLNLSLNYRMTMMVGFAGALLAGFGLDALAVTTARRRPLGTALLVGAALAGAIALAPHVPWPESWLPACEWADSFPPPTAEAPYVHAAVEPRWWLLGGCALLLPLLAVARRSSKPWDLLRVAALAVACLDLYGFARGFNPSASPERIFPPTRVTDWLGQQPGPFRIWCVDKGTLPPETAGVYGLEDVRGYDAMSVERVSLLRSMLRPNQATSARGLVDGEDLDVGHPLFGVLDVGFVLAPTAWTPPPDARLVRVLEVKNCAVWRNDGWHARAFLCGTAQDVRPFVAEASARSGVPEPLALRTIAQNIGADLRERWVGAQGAPPFLTLEGDTPRPVPVTGRVEPLERAELHESWSVHASGPCWLVVSEAFFPGWHAQVDGRDTAIEAAFFGLRAVRVPAGDSVVSFRYEPASLRWGAAASALGLLLLGAGVWWGRRAGRVQEL